MSIFSRPSVAVLFVCTANICRSPMAEAILREELKLLGLQRKILVDSAGTHASQTGHPADGRARQVCAREGIDLRGSRARQVVEGDFSRFDYILAADGKNREWLLASAPDEFRSRVSLIGDWAADGSVQSIPDPYYGSVVGFEEILPLMHRAIDGFLDHLTQQFTLK